MAPMSELTTQGLSFFDNATAVAHLRLDNSTPAAPKIRVYAADGTTPGYLEAKIAAPAGGSAPGDFDAVNAKWIKDHVSLQIDASVGTTPAGKGTVKHAIDTAISDSVATGGTVKAAIESAFQAANTEVTELQGRARTLEDKVAGLTNTEPVAADAINHTPAVRRQVAFADADLTVYKLSATDLRVTNLTTVNQTVTNTTITDQCVVYNYGATGDLDASLLFAKSNLKQSTNTYAGMPQG